VAGPNEEPPSCAGSAKQIGSVAAIVASFEGDFGQGRVGVFSTSALRILTKTLQTLLFAPFPSVMTLLVFADIVDFSLIPKTDFNPSNRLNGRNGKFLLPNPTVKCVPTNADKFRDFYSGIGRHLNNRIGLYGCQVKCGTGAAQDR